VLPIATHRIQLARPCAAALLSLLALLCSALPQAAAAADADSPYALPLQWQDDQGNPVRLEQFRGKPLLLTMAYATCRETCSYALRRLDQLQQEAAQAGQAVQIVIVSYDPANDGPKSWTNYRQHHSYVHPNWHFLTGSDAATRELAGALDFKYWSYDEHVVHDFKILLLDADGKVTRELTWPNREESLFVNARP
jgi:protein SCO1